ncbi:MAG TPA: AIM24 family protein [Acidimicrobiales bacterium]
MTLTTKITGGFSEHITCQLEPGKSVFAEAGKFRWKTTNVTMETRLSTPGGKADQANQQAQQSGGSFLKAALATATEVGKRVLTGQSLAFQWFTPSGGSGLVSFAGDEPGQVRAIEIENGVGWRAESRALICAEGTVHYDIDWGGFNLGRRSKEGFIFEHFTGEGTVLVAGGGSLINLNPANYGGKIQVHAGAVVAFADSVTFNVERIGSLNAQAIMTAAFGGTGINLVTLSGDGPIVLQSTLHRRFEDEDRDVQDRDGTRRDGLFGRI